MTEHAKSLFEQVLHKISQGKTHLVIWGIDVVSVELLAKISSCGMSQLVTAVIDESANTPLSMLGFHVIEPELLSTVECDLVVITTDIDKDIVLEQFISRDARCPDVVFYGDAHYSFRDPVYSSILKSCAVKSKAGGYPLMLPHLYQALTYIATRKLDGIIVEFGVFQGGTTVFMAKVLKALQHPCTIFGFDTFSGFPGRKNAADLYNDSKCEFHDYDSVAAYCAPYNIKLIPGDISQTYSLLEDENIALTFCDTDNYSGIRNALELCYERTVPGGIIALDHWYSPGWGRTIGERVAAIQAFNGRSMLNFHGTGIFIKI